MLIAYCEKCGMRVPEAPAEQSGPVFCKSCAPAVGAKAAGSGRMKSPAKGSGVQVAVRKNESPAPTAGSTSGKPRGGVRESQASTGMIMGVGGIVIGLVFGVFLAFGGSSAPANNTANASSKKKDKSATKNEPKTNAAVKNDPAPANVVKPPDTGTSKSTPRDEEERKLTTPAQPVVDVREEFAARKWTELQAAKLTPHEKYKQIDAFAQSYASTKPGKEAADWLQKNPAPPPPPPPVITSNPAVAPNTVVSSTLDTDPEIAKWTRNGLKDTTVAYGGKGASVKAKTLDDPQSYFGASLSFHFDEDIVVKDTWVRFAYKAEGASRFFFHSSFDDGLYEAVVGGVETGKWKWCTLKLSDYKKAIRGPGLPANGMRMKGVALLAVRVGDKTTIYVDNLTVGEGPIPDPPKE